MVDVDVGFHHLFIVEKRELKGEKMELLRE